MDSQLTLSLASSGVYSQGMLSPVTSAKRPELNAAAIGTKANPADRKRLVFVAMLAWIAFVSCFDIYCSFLTEEVLAESEENPIGRWLIALDGGSIHLFMKVKTAGTFLVLTLLYLLLVLRPSWGWICCTSVSVFQVWLMFYLNFGHIFFPKPFQ